MVWGLRMGVWINRAWVGGGRVGEILKRSQWCMGGMEMLGGDCCAEMWGSLSTHGDGQQGGGKVGLRGDAGNGA